ncbi:MAG TPA: hypothetical protein VKE26_07075, partial [Xanthobacteraceae bacterium]|nr:hypothetical protein [Xanthobacteraceae bacterium]
MTYQLMHGVVVEHRRRIIHILRVLGDALDPWEVDALAEEMRKRLLSRTGEQAADVVVVHGTTRETLRISGEPFSVSRVRTAMFNAAVTWSPVAFD